jgi:hypothetical protein
MKCVDFSFLLNTMFANVSGVGGVAEPKAKKNYKT